MPKFSSRDLSIIIKGQSVNKTVKDLDIKVTATKTLSANPNQANIEIYNLNQNSREELYNNVYDFSNESKPAIISVQAVLDGKTIFQGDLINVNSIYSNTAAEWKTILYCGEGYNATRQKVNKKYDKGSTRKEIVDDLINELSEAGVAVSGAVEGFTKCADKSILKAILINGEVVKNIKELYKDCFSEIDVYIDEGKVNMLAERAIIPNNRVVINSGLIEPPTLSEQGINCKVIINPTVKIGAEFQVVSRSQNYSFGNLTVNKPQKSRISGDGIYRVQEVKHTVDNFSQEVATTEIIGLNSGRT